MMDISVIILTYNEELHIKRCIENIKNIASKIFVIDSNSTDNTATIAESLGATVIQHKWPGNQAEQFNWALENVDIKTEWVLRLDADEYLLPELINEIENKLPTLEKDITGITFKRRHTFMGRWIKRGTYPVMILRMFRKGKAICEQRLMDEHIELLEGKSITFENDFVDHNLNNISWWAEKHINYAVREAAELIDIEHNITKKNYNKRNLSRNTLQKRLMKHKYAKQPIFWRSFAYFCYRYFFRLGFLEGKEGFMWHFMQGWWYRTMVDAKIFEIKRECKNDKEKIVKYLKENYNITL